MNLAMDDVKNGTVLMESRKEKVKLQKRKLGN